MPTQRPETGLHSFVDDTQQRRPVLVKARALDSNFVRCMPAERGLLARGLNFTEEGWYIDLQPPGAGTYVLGSVNGTLQWIETQDCDSGGGE